MPEPCIQEEHVQEDILLDTSEEQGCIEDHLVEEQEAAPFSLTDSWAEFSHPPRYDTSDDDSFEQPILGTLLGSDPIYDDYASYSESNEDIDDILSTSEWEVSHQNVACVEDIHLIIDMLNKEHKQVENTSSYNSKVTILAQDQSDVKEEAPLSPSAHQGAHHHLHQPSSPFLGEERDQPITNFCKGDVEVEKEKTSSILLEGGVCLCPTNPRRGVAL